MCELVTTDVGMMALHANDTETILALKINLSQAAAIHCGTPVMHPERIVSPATD